MIDLVIGWLWIWGIREGSSTKLRVSLSVGRSGAIS